MISKHMPITARQTKGYYRVLWLCLVVKLGGSGYIRFLSMFQQKKQEAFESHSKRERKQRRRRSSTAVGKRINVVDIGTEAWNCMVLLPPPRPWRVPGYVLLSVSPLTDQLLLATQLSSMSCLVLFRSLHEMWTTNFPVWILDFLQQARSTMTRCWFACFCGIPMFWRSAWFYNNEPFSCSIVYQWHGVSNRVKHVNDNAPTCDCTLQMPLVQCFINSFNHHSPVASSLSPRCITPFLSRVPFVCISWSSHNVVPFLFLRCPLLFSPC